MITFNDAVKAITDRIFPSGFKVGSDAPNSYADLKAYVSECNHMKVTNSYPEDPVFNDAGIRFAFRAWHDWTHLAIGAPFTLQGECATARAQYCQLAVIYGEQAAKEWWPILHLELIEMNFTPCTTCPEDLALPD